VADLELFEAPDPRVTAGSTIGNRAGFQGHDHDPDTGLAYMRNRWLDPELGRFVSADPMGYVDAPSLYGFARNNPLTYSDPLGLIVRFAKLGNQDQVGVLSQSERVTITDGLSDFVGADFTIDPNSNELSMGSVHKNSSPTAVKLVQDLIKDARVWMVYVMVDGWVPTAFTDINVVYREKPVFLDLGDIATIKCTGKKMQCNSFGLGAILIHEFVHAYHYPLGDPPTPKVDSTTGPTTDYVNRMRRELGLPERITYLDRITRKQKRLGLRSTSFRNAKGKRVGTATLDKAKEDAELTAYQNWCTAERAQTGRPSKCQGSAIWDKRPVP